MTVPLPRDDTKQRAEETLANLEAFYDDFCNRTPFSRKPLLPKLEHLQSHVTGASGSDGYVIQKLTSLSVYCKRLANLRPPSGFDDAEACRLGLSCVSSVRIQMHVNGLVEHSNRRRS